MGVRGLQTFIEQQCPDSIRKVSLKEMTKTFKEQNPSIEEPIIAIDGRHCLYSLYNGLDWLCGGQWLQFIRVLQNFVTSLQNLGLKPVFFFDGATSELKIKNFHKKWKQHLKEIIDMCDLLKNKVTDPKCNFQLPESMTILTCFALKFYCKVPVYTIINSDCNQIISTFAAKHNCLAILAHDSDYIIISNVPYISISQMDLTTLETVSYDRDIFCAQMNISVAQLPLLACLMGNCRYVPQQYEFHQKILLRYCDQISLPAKTSNRSKLLACIIHYIRSLQLDNVSDLNRRLPSICEYVFGTASKSQHLQKDLQSYELCFSDCKLYRYPFDQQTPTDLSNPEGIFDHILQKSITNDISLEIFHSIHFGTWYMNATLEDEMSNSDSAAVLIYRPIRSRLYDLILTFKDKHINGKIAIKLIGRPPTNNSYINEYWFSSKNQTARPDRVYRSPVSVNDSLPDLLMLWKDTNSATEQLKWETVQACLNLSQSIECLKQIPDKFKLLCMILNYLIQCPIVPLESWEVDAFVVQSVLPNALEIEWIRDLEVQPYDERAVYLAFIFFHGSTEFNSVLSICGAPYPIEDSMPWHCFDGKRFHHCYKTLKSGTSVEDLCLNNAESLVQYKLLKEVTYTNLTI